MDIRQLKYFIAIAEEGNITKAANKLHISQPPLTRQLQQMEDELGLLLFERSRTRGMVLTAEGEMFLRRANDVVGKLDDSIVEIREYSCKLEKKLTIGATIYCASIMHNKMMKLQKKDLNFSIWEGPANKLFELIDNRKVEIAIVNGPIPSKEFETKKLKKDPYVVVAAENSDFFSNNEVSLEEIAAAPFVILRPEIGPGVYDKIVNTFHEKGLQLHVICECFDTSMLLNMVYSGLGVTILPSSMLEMNYLSDLKSFKIKDNPFYLKPMLVWKKDRYLTRAAQQFLELT